MSTLFIDKNLIETLKRGKEKNMFKTLDHVVLLDSKESSLDIKD